VIAPAAAVLDLLPTAPNAAVPEPATATPEPTAAEVQAATSDVLTSAQVLDLGSSAGVIPAAEPQQQQQQPADGTPDGVVSAAATANVLDLTATGLTSGKTPELIAVNVGHR
jgi:hypothetical protein